MLKPVSLTLLVAAAQAFGQASPFEPEDFNATEALLAQGFDPAAIPVVPETARRDCKSLRLVYGADLLTSEEPAYGAFTGSYWAAQQVEVSPACILKAPDATAVSVAVLISRLTQCPFAAKSGGHSHFPASAIEGGITISFEKMKDVTVADDRKTVHIQPGNVWGEVFDKLADTELTVVGGRIYPVGTGGLTLGGGLSFFSGLYGLACDNIAKYTVVTAMGLIVEATPTQHPDLYWALRGGTNNFGLVVEFEAMAYPLPANQVWGGTRVFQEDQFPGLLDAYIHWVTNAADDTNIGGWLAWIYRDGRLMATTETYSAKPVADPPLFDGYKNLTAIQDTTKVRTLHEYARTLNATAPYGLREMYEGITVKVDHDLIQAAADIYFEEVTALKDIEGFAPNFITQPLSVPMMSHMSRNGGNPLGLDPANGPLAILQTATMWNNAKDDATIAAYSNRVLSRITAEAKSRGLDSDYIYLNYASKYQDVFAGYGQANLDKMRKISKKYDPAQVFQTLQPLYFKLNGGAPGKE
ncbi:hypothetical protein FQN50_001944 [Emmonsiellopsis sp. PD_5]|nr:hypothetical protein FQN50_001944 [Emmonsiellopsis sp. PD_5]